MFKQKTKIGKCFIVLSVLQQCRCDDYRQRDPPHEADKHTGDAFSSYTETRDV